jgi:hypothetical protein
MATTDLFVELVIIGMGTAMWLILLILSVFGYEWVPLEKMFSLAALIPFLSVVYVLGIVIDRIADAIFDKLWRRSLLKKVYGQEEKYLDDRRLIYIHPGRLGDLLEYGRSRLRICRGWTLNSVLILVSLDVFIWTRIADADLRIGLLIFCNLLLCLFAYGNWFSWRQLCLTYYRKAKAQSAFLRAAQSTRDAGAGPGDDAHLDTG